MPHIHTEKNQHDHTVTAYVVRTDTPEPKVLLHMHKILHRLLPVGGHIELSETPWQAMAHELEEESGYELNQLQILQPSLRIKQASDVVLHPYPLAMNTHNFSDVHFHSDTAYGFIASGEPNLEVGEEESADIRWLTLNEFRALHSDMLFENTREVYEFMVTEALGKWEKVSATDFSL